MNSGGRVIVSAPLSARPGLRWCPVQVVRAVLVCVGFGLLILLIFNIYLSILFYLLSILSIYLFIFIYIYILDTRLLLLSIGAAGLLWRRLAAREMTGRGRLEDARTFSACQVMPCGLIPGPSRPSGLWRRCPGGLRAASCFGLPVAGAGSRARFLVRCLIIYIII